MNKDVDNPRELLRRLGGDLETPHAPLLADFGALTGRIGLFGGSFDPPHLGHLIAARSLLRQLDLSACVLVPTHRNPLKPASPIAGDECRLKMLELALAREPLLYVSAIELGGPADAASYTADTLRKIRAQASRQSSLFFLIGSDLIPSLPQWKDVEQLASLAAFVPYQRAGHRLTHTLTELRLPAALQRQLEAGLCTVPAVDISATAIRETIAGGAVPRDTLPANVAEYIESTGVYRRSNQIVEVQSPSTAGGPVSQ